MNAFKAVKEVREKSKYNLEALSKILSNILDCSIDKR